MKYKLGDILESISETFDKNREFVVLINTSDVYDGKVLNHEFVKNKNLKGQFKKKFQNGDILFSEIRPQNRRFAFVDFLSEGYVASTKLMVLRNKSNMVNTRYLFHILKSQEIIDKLQLLAESRSGTFPQITFSELASLEVEIPSLDIQTSIVFIMDSIENKIRLNSEINDNLEELSRTLYNKIFKNVTEKGILSDIVDIVMGQSPSGTSYNEIGDGVVFYQGRAEFGWRFPSRRLFTTEPKRMATENAVLMSVRAPVGDLNIANESCCIGRGLAAISSKTNAQSFVFYLLDSMKNQLNIYNGEGTVFGSINKEALAKLEIILPSKELVDKFESVIAPIDEKILRLSQNTRSLVKMRDSLLPKLNSGEIDLINFEVDI